MSLSIAKSILYGIPRRGGLQTEWQHAFAVASVAVGLATAYGLSKEEVDRIQQVAFFHDIMEVAPEEGKKVITLLNNIGGIYEDLLININMLSHFEDENSAEAFERVMIVGTRDQTVVKMADCFINSLYTDEEKHWHWETFRTNWSEESAKYIRRYQVLFNELYKRLG